MSQNSISKRTSALLSKASRRGAVVLGASIAIVLTAYSVQSVRANLIDWSNPAGGDFNTAGNWSPNTVPGAGDIARFNIATGDVTWSTDIAPGSINFDTGATSFALGMLGGNTLTTANGGSIAILSTLTGTGQTFTINAPIILTPASATSAGTYTFQNDASSATTTLQIAGNVSAGTTTGTETLTLAGTNTGTNTISGVISNGGAASLALTKTGAGTWVLSGANTYTGGTTIAAGTLALTGGDNRLATTSTVKFTGTNGTLDLGSTNQTLAGITFSNTGTSTNVITGGAGSLSIAGGTTNFQVGGGDATNTSSAITVDMSGLGSFSYNRTAGTFGAGGTSDSTTASTTASGTLFLAKTNTITAGTFAAGVYSTGANAINSGTIHLGQTNTINATTFIVGNQKTIGVLDFQTGLVAPTLKIRGTGGTDADRAAITIGNNNSGLTATTATFDLTNGGTISSTLDAMVSTLIVGLNARVATTVGLPTTATFTMGLGTLNATTIVIGQQAALTGGNTASGQANGTMSLNGGTVTATTFTLADKQSGAATQGISSTFNLNSGTLNATTIQRGAVGTGAGANLASINFNWVDGTISNITGANQTVNGVTAVSGLTGGLTIALNNTGNVSGTHTWNVSGTQTSTVQNTVSLTGAGSLTKTGTGTLALNGVNSYTGPTVITAGTVKFGTEASLYNGNTANWTAANLTVNSGAIAAFNVGGAGEFTAADIDLLKTLSSPTGGFRSGSGIGLDTTNAGAGFTYSGVIANPGSNTLSLTKLGTGTLTLSGANIYSGGTNIAGGTLALNGGDNRLLSTSTVNFTGTSGTLDVGSTNQTLAGLTFPISGTNNHVVKGAGGSLTITGSTFQVGGGSPTIGGTDTVDMTGLSTFNYTNSAGTFSVGGKADVGTSTSAAGTLSMATVNNITASSFLVSPVSSGNTSPNTGTLHLGQTNVINATTFTVGVGKSTSTLDFQGGLTLPTLKIRGTGGTDADRATVLISTNDSGAAANVATMDVSAGVLDAMVGTMTIGANTRNNTAGFASTGTFIMGAGSLNATQIIVGSQAAVTGSNSSGNATGTLTLNGGTISATTLTLANKGSGAATQTITSNINLNSGTLNAGTITRGTAGTGAGASTATINFNWVDGTIGNIANADQTVSGNTALSGLTGGLNIVLNNTGNLSGTHTWNVSGTQTATIQSTATLSGAGSLTKAGNGTLVLAGANSYAGATTINAGELDLNATAAQAIAGNVTLNAGTLKLLQASQINAASNIAVNGGTFNLQTFAQTLANVQLTGGTIAGTTGTLTSTSAYDLQSGTVSAILAGTAGANKTTGGMVTLSGANTFSGGTNVSGGILVGTNAKSLGTNSGLTVGNGATFVYRPTAAGALNLGTGAISLAGGSTIGTAVGGTAGQSAITSSVAATTSGAIGVSIYGITGVAPTTGVNNLLTVASGLTSGGATYTPLYYNLTNATASNFQVTDTTMSVTLTAATALTNAYWKGGLGVGDNVWAVSNGTASNWATDVSGTGTALVPGSTTTITFSTNSATNQGGMVLGTNLSIKGIVVADTNAVTLNADGNSLTVGTSGILVNGGAGAVTLNAPLILGAAQAWTNNSSNTLNVSGAVTNGGFTLTSNGSGNTTVSGSISGTGGVSKSGTGTLTLSGDNAFTGAVTVSGGKLNLTGNNASAGTMAISGGAAVNLSGTYTAAINIATTTANTTGILNILPGTSISGTATAFAIGNAAGSAGAMYQSGGDILLNNNLNFGLGGTVAAPSFGFYSLSGGTVTDTNGSNVRFRVGGGASYSTGVFYQSGGTVNIAFTNGLEVGANGTGSFINGNGVAYFTGGSFTAISNRIGYNNTAGGSGNMRGEETVAGNALVTINGTTTLGLASGDSGVLNLNGGVYATRQITRTNGSGVVNFNGSTLKAAPSANGGSFLTGLSSANIYSGGATIDTNNQNLTIGQALLAPTGSGVATIAVTDGGSGYTGAPLVTITGAGSGATAVANMVDDGTGNGTYKIASITVTNAGIGYTSAPTVALSGGGGTGTVLGTVTTIANASGGLTKTGLGTLTLSSNSNTYSGNTAVNQGTLLVTGSISGSTVDVNNNGTLAGTGSVGAINLNNGGSLSPGNAGTGILNSSGTVNLNSGSTFKLELNTTSNATDLLATTGGLNLALSNDAILSITDLGGTSTLNPFVFITYASGTWNGGLFTVNGSVIADDSLLTVGVNTFKLDYNYNGDSVALIAVPEPSTLIPLASGIGMLLGLRRMRRRHLVK
jgi:autotransporter-associated beta strand protein